MGKIYDKVPFKVALEKDKQYSWCTCGCSKKQVWSYFLLDIYKNRINNSCLWIHNHTLKINWNTILFQPFCDGSHKELNASNPDPSTHFRSHKFVANETKEYFLCNCKQTKNRAFCDGTHKEKLVQEADLSAAWLNQNLTLMVVVVKECIYASSFEFSVILFLSLAILHSLILKWVCFDEIWSIQWSLNLESSHRVDICFLPQHQINCYFLLQISKLPNYLSSSHFQLDAAILLFRIYERPDVTETNPKSSNYC